MKNSQHNIFFSHISAEITSKNFSPQFFEALFFELLFVLTDQVSKMDINRVSSKTWLCKSEKKVSQLSITPSPSESLKSHDSISLKSSCTSDSETISNLGVGYNPDTHEFDIFKLKVTLKRYTRCSSFLSSKRANLALYIE